MFNKLVFFVGLFFLSHITLAEQHRLIKVAKPIEQAVFLKLDPSQERYSGEVNIKLKVTENTRRLQFNGLDFEVTQASLVQGKKVIALTSEQKHNGIVEVNAAEVIKPGKYQLNVTFDSPYNRNSVGLYKSIDQEIPYLFTQFEMSDARRAFPVFDEPNYKIPFQLTIASPKTNKVFSNTPELKVEQDGDWLVHYFDKTPKLSSYLVALAVGPFDVVEIKGMKVPARVITTKGKGHLTDYAVETIPKALEALEAYFGRPYPYKKLDSVALPEFPFGAMENAGLVTYREDLLLVDKNNSSQGAKTGHVMVIAHELAHQWYGNLVTMDWWDDLWLNEAFASWMAAKITHQIAPELEYDQRLPQNGAMGSDALVTTKPIRKPITSEADIMDGLGLAYSKGSAILTMVEQWLGEHTFRDGVRTYINRFAWKNAKAADLWGTLSEVSNKDVKGVLQSYTEQSSYPIVDVKVEGKQVTLSQQRFIAAGVQAENHQWNLPVALRYGNDEKSKIEIVHLTKKQQTFTLAEKPQWLFPDANAKGYYRWKLDSASLENLLANANKVLNTRERKILLANSKDLMNAGELSGAEYMQTLSASLKDESIGVVKQAVSGINSLERAFKTNDTKSKWRNYLLAQIQPLTERFGLEAKDDEDPQVKSLRATLIYMLAIDAESKPVIDQAKQQVKLYLSDPEKVDPSLSSTYLRIAAFYGDSALYKEMVTAFEQTTNPKVKSELLGAISSFNAEPQHKSALAYQLSDNITASDLRYSLSYNVGYNDERRLRLQQWLFDNFDQVANKVPPFVVPSLPYYLSGVCSVDEYQPALSFFEKKSETVPGMKRTITKVLDRIESCQNLRKRELASVTTYLQSF